MDNDTTLEVQKDGTVLETKQVSIDELSTRLTASEGFLTAAQASRDIAMAEWDAKIAGFQADVDSLRSTISQVPTMTEVVEPAVSA